MRRILTNNVTGFPNDVCIFPLGLFSDGTPSERLLAFNFIHISIKSDIEYGDFFSFLEI